MSQDPATLKALELAKIISKSLVGGGTTPSVSQNTMQIPSDKVGLVIGRGGTTIKEIESTTGVKLQLEPTGEPFRNVYIRGSEENINKAKEKIKMILEERIKGRGSSLNPTKTIPIPCDQVGLIIGRGGSNIRKISQETGCHLKIESEEQAEKSGRALPIKGYQNLHIMGTPAAAHTAEMAVMELLQKEAIQRLQREALKGYGSYHQQFYQMRAQPYGTPAVGLAQSYGSFVANPYATTNPVIEQSYATQSLGYPVVSGGYAQQI